MTGEADVPRFLERDRLPHAVTPGPGAAEVGLASVLGLRGTMAKPTVRLGHVMLGVTRDAVLGDGHGEWRGVTGSTLHIGMPAVPKGDFTGLRLPAYGDRKADGHLMRLTQLRRLVAASARGRPFRCVVAALAIALTPDDELTVALSASMTRRAFDISMLAM